MIIDDWTDEYLTTAHAGAQGTIYSIDTGDLQFQHLLWKTSAKFQVEHHSFMIETFVPAWIEEYNKGEAHTYPGQYAGTKLQLLLRFKHCYIVLQK